MSSTFRAQLLFYPLLIGLLVLGHDSSVAAQPFSDGRLIISTDSDGARDVHAADVDGDGDQDVISGFSDGVRFSRNGNADSGDGDGSSWTTIEVSTSGFSNVVQAADIDGDGDQDIISDTNSPIEWYQNEDGAGGGKGNSWNSISIPEATFGDGARGLLASDVDGDGDQDIVLGVASANEGVLYEIKLYRNGDATSGAGDGTSWSESLVANITSGELFDAFAADVDGDGDQDIISASSSGILWHRNGDFSGGGTGSSWSTVTVTESGAESVFATDIDGDGDQDILSARNSGGGIVFYRNGDSSGGGVGSSWTAISVTPGTSEDVFAADVDGDGDQDVLSNSYSYDEVRWHQNGDSDGGGSGSSWTTNIVSTSAEGALGVFASDIDGNGAQDILSASTGDNTVRWYENARTPIPVELVAFDVSRRSNDAILSWQTASEQNNAGFEVQRRLSDEWEPVSFIDGTGTTSKPQTYRFQDSNLPFEAESVNYRLKQIDTDGTTSFSDTRTLQIGAPDRVTLHTPFPNPARGQITLRYALPRKADLSIRVYDVMGRRVATLQRGTEDAGRKEIRVPTSDFSSGVYFVRLQASETVKTERLTVVK